MDTSLVQRRHLVDVYLEGVRFLWISREIASRAPNIRLRNFIRLDERVEAHIDALRVAGQHAWTLVQEGLERAEAGTFFATGVLVIEGSGIANFEGTIEQAHEAAQRIADQPYEPAYDPWRGLVSALAWVD